MGLTFFSKIFGFLVFFFSTVIYFSMLLLIALGKFYS
ncbi:hypothetical protein WN943_024634 [Citrus x changshan-huyou]